MTEEMTDDVSAGPAVRRRQTLAGLLVIGLFTAGMLQFAGLYWRAWPAESRVNNGAQPTFFAVHINPYGVFSEDFHLYAVRAKRIRDRGWTDSLLYRREGAGTNIVAPIQVLVGRIAVATGGEPVRYACFLTVLLTLAWGGLFLAVRRWLPAELSWGVALFAVLVTVNWENAEYLFRDPPFSSDQWPVNRGLRVATNAWTSPLLAALLLLASSIPFAERLPVARFVGLAAMLGVLAGADNWTFAVAWLACGWLLAGTSILGLIRWRTKGQSLAKSLATPLGLAVVLGSTLVLHKLLTSALAGDVMLRSGMGPDWMRDIFAPPEWKLMIRAWGTRYGFWTLASIIGLAIVISRFGRRDPRDRTPGSRLVPQLLLVAGLPQLAMPTLLFILRSSGMELFLANQIYWRVNYVLLLVFMLLAGEVLRRIVTRSGGWRRQSAGASERTWRTIVVVALCSLFVVHQVRIDRFIRKVAARDFFLTADAEHLRDWLQDYERRKGPFSLATVSHELNHLCAYWTDADLLLPEGFPYHSAADNAEIRRRTVSLLRLYGATPTTWKDFARPGQGNDQEDWHRSRTLSTQEGFLYYLYHRAAQLHSPEHRYWAWEERERIAEELVGDEDPVPRPDVIVIDGAARLLGPARLDGYELAFEHGDLAAWVRSDAGRP